MLNIFLFCFVFFAFSSAVVYDGCPKSFDAGIWWPKTRFGRPAAMDCPKGSVGVYFIYCMRIILIISSCEGHHILYGLVQGSPTLLKLSATLLHLYLGLSQMKGNHFATLS